MNENKVNTNTPEKRLLAVYDLSAQPCAIGDFLNFVQATLVLCEYNHLDKVDFCFITEASDCCVPELKSMVNEDNRYFHLFSILPIVQLNPRLGAVHIFDSKKEFRDFIDGRGDNCSVWPPLHNIESKAYLFYDICVMLTEYYRIHGSLPYITARKDILARVKSYYRENVLPSVPVTVNIRNNPQWGDDRNSDIELLKEFFQYCESLYPVKFIIICSSAEIDDRLRNGNVLFAKESGSTIEQDLAFIQTSILHIGAPSGPATMATFTAKPYLILNTNMGNHLPLYRGSFVLSDGYLTFGFAANHLQRFAYFKENFDILTTEFEKMWQAVDPLAWKRHIDAGTNESLGLLTNLR